LSKERLPPEDRLAIQSHVVHSLRILSAVPWPAARARVPDFIHAHHERLDGSGYPRGIPAESRMITIADIFDALVSMPRSRRRAITAERTLSVLRDEARRGALDRDLVELFVSARSWAEACARP